MSRFFVGQRVRIVDAHKSKFLIGTETTVTGLNVVGIGAGGRSEYVGTMTSATNWCGKFFVARQGQLEPIIDKHQPCESEFKTTLDKLLEGLPA